jgi:hypothetical protein
MRPTALKVFLAVIALSIGTPASAWSQWSLSLALESDRYWGGSLELDNSPEQKSFRPYRPTVFGVGVEHRTGSVGLGLRARYAEAGLGLEGSGAVVAAKGAFTVVGLAPEMSYQVATLGPGNRLLLHLGPLFEFWHPIDQEWRTRVGVQGAVSLAVPLGGRFGLSIDGNVGVTASPFRADELLDLYDLRPLWRRGISGGIQYRL